MAQPLVILGTYDLALEVADLAEAAGSFEVTHFAENRDRARAGTEIHGRPVLWVDDLAELARTHRAVCAIGTTRRFEFTERVERLGMRFATVAHPAASVLPSATVGEGCILGPGSGVASRAVLGRHVFLNRAATVGHQTVVGDHGTIGPGAQIAGRCTVGARVYLGIGAIVLNDLKVGDDSVVAAGALVHRDVAARTLVAGHPAEVVRTGIDGK